MKLHYVTRGRLFSSGADCVVTEGEREVATVTLEPGGVRRGPTWDWTGALGLEWRLTALRSDRSYEVRRTDGRLLGALDRQRFRSSVTLRAADASQAEVARRPVLGRTRTVTLPDGSTATVVRDTPSITFSSTKRWTLELPAELTDPLRSLLLALPLVLDHQRRRAETRGLAAGGASS